MEDKINFISNGLIIESYEVNGKVTDINGNVIPEVIIRFSSGDSSVIIDTNGEWNKKGLNGEVSVRPEKYGYIFVPEERIVSGNEDYVNFRANSMYTASGKIYIKDTDEGITGVELLYEGLEPEKGYESVISNNQGVWTKRTLIGKVKVTPNLEGWNFIPYDKMITSLDNEEINFRAYPDINYKFYSVSGKVIDNESKGIPAIKILFKRNNETVWTTYSKENGEFSVGDYLWGSIKVEADDSIYTFEPNNYVIDKITEGIIFKGK